jgi:hypothetical protein
LFLLSFSLSPSSSSLFQSLRHLLSFSPGQPLIAPTATMSFTDEELDRNWQPNGRRPQSYVNPPPLDGIAMRPTKKAHWHLILHAMHISG